MINFCKTSSIYGKIQHENPVFKGRFTMQNDSFEKENKKLYKVNFINSSDEYEGYFSFFLPNSQKTVLARYLGGKNKYFQVLD